jgi:N-acetylglucosaminyldiphosphoundecaprenol N-acetyl-beta-D-mannosaminyltransferase
MGTYMVERLQEEKHPQANILGVAISPVNMQLAVNRILEWLKTETNAYVCVTSVHGVIESQADEQLRSIHNRAGMVTPDGMPLVWMMRSQGFDECSRVYGPDLLPAVIEETVELGYSHFFYGASQKTLDSLQANLQLHYPGLVIAGTYSPPYRALTSEEETEIGERINNSGAAIVWVGLSTPKQEKWMATFRDRLDARVLLGVGAAFDFHAGCTRQAPCFIRSSGFEWLFRLLTEPKRLWKRYFKIVPSFLFLVLLQKIGLKKFSLKLK